MPRSDKVFPLFFFIFTVSCIFVPILSIKDDNWGFTLVDPDEFLTFRWTIQNYNLTNVGTGVSFRSLNFSTPRIKWNLDFFPNGQLNENYTSAALNLLSPIEKSQFVTCIIYLLNTETKATFFPMHLKSCKHDLFVPIDSIPNFLNNDKLTIVIKVGLFTFRKYINFNDCVKETSSLEDIHTKRLTYILENELFSDVTLMVNGHKIKAHKSILASVSPFFLDQFKNTSNSVVEIKDVDYEVFKKFLRYAYTDEVEKTVETADALIHLAHKFEIEKLKKICENIICLNLHTNNVLSVYYTGLSVRSNFLSDLALKYKSNEWKRLPF